MRIVFCGGGTAGHVTPTIAIAERIQKRDKNAEILFIGREGGNENRAVSNAKIPLETLKISGIERKLTAKNIKNAFTALKALSKAKSILKSFNPDIVIGTGGYVCWPVLKSAQRMKIKTVLHESNACPGLVTRLLGPRCDILLLNLKGSEKEFKKRDNIRTVGNPVREDFTVSTKKEARKRLGISKNELLISSFGGSGGAETLNEVIIKLMDHHTSRLDGIVHIHSAGVKYFDKIADEKPRYTNGNSHCTVKKYVDNMADTLLASDIVISRSGAMTLAELAAVGAAAILIPSPNVTNDHQLKNAKLLATSDACILIEEKNLTERVLTEAVRYLESNRKKRESLGERIHSFHVPQAADEICDIIFELVNLSAPK